MAEARATAKSEGRLIERGVFEHAGHRIDKLPCGRGYTVHPDHRWFEQLRDAKRWLRAHTDPKPQKPSSCGCKHGSRG